MVKHYDIPKARNGVPLSDEERLELCIRKFNKDFPTNKDCVDELFRRYCPDGKCRCGSGNITRKPGARSFKCNACRVITWFTANTTFHQVKKVRIRLLYDTIMENGIAVNAAEFERITGVDRKTARAIFASFTKVIVDKLMVKNFVLTFSRVLTCTFLRRRKTSCRRWRQKAKPNRPAKTRS
jgi:hypothetical protein